MGQYDILQLLKEEPCSVEQLAKKTRTITNSVRASLRRLLNWGDVFFIKIKTKHNYTTLYFTLSDYQGFLVESDEKYDGKFANKQRIWFKKNGIWFFYDFLCATWKVPNSMIDDNYFKDKKILWDYKSFKKKIKSFKKIVDLT